MEFGRVLIGIDLLVTLLCVGMFIRNNLVYKERMRLLNLVRTERAEVDMLFIAKIFSFMKDVSYDYMIYRFWKPVSSFWKDYNNEQSHE